MLDRLEPVRPLREGGEGRVLLAWDPTLSRWLAVKLVRLAPGARALGEALLAKLGAFAKEMLEPAVAPILASGLSDAAPAEFRQRFGLTDGLYLYVVMPYVHGLPAHELAAGPLGAREAAALFVGAARLLARLHGQGLLHLDLKPANVIIDVQGRVVLIDPLLALLYGTSAYAAPDPEPGPAADRYALGRLVAAVWTGRYPESARDGLPDLPQPGVELTGKERLAHGRFRKQLEELAKGDPEGRTLDLAVAEAFAGDLGASDGAATLAAAVGASPFRKSLVEIELAQAERGGDSVRSEPFDEAQGRLRRGPNPGQVRPSTSLGANGSALRSKLAWAVGALVPLLLAAAGYAFRQQHPAHVNPQPSSIAWVPSDRPWNSACKISFPAKPLGPTEEAPPEDAVFQLDVHQLVDRWSLRLLYGPEVLVMPDPRPGDSCKVRLPPGTYERETVYPGGKGYKDTLEIQLGKPNHDITHPFGNLAPVLPTQTINPLVLSSQGPTFLALGPCWIDDASWDAAAGALSIASGDCKDPTRELPWSPKGRGASDVRFHLERQERLCAYPKPDAKRGFLQVHLTETDDNAPP